MTDELLDDPRNALEPLCRLGCDPVSDRELAKIANNGSEGSLELGSEALQQVDRVAFVDRKEILTGQCPATQKIPGSIDRATRDSEAFVRLRVGHRDDRTRHHFARAHL